MRAIHHSLTQANGWGSAGQCPATSSAKTPAARESGASSRRSLDDTNHPGGGTFTDGTAQLQNRLLRAELAQLCQAARDYYLQTRPTDGGGAAGEHLVQLLAHAEFVA